MKLSKPERYILEWNSRFPIDLWWRRKYNVPFGSSQHLEMSHWSMFLEFTETQLVEKWKKSSESKELAQDLASLGFTSADGKEVVKIAPGEIDSEFDSLDIDQFDNRTVKVKVEDDNLLP